MNPRIDIQGTFQTLVKHRRYTQLGSLPRRILGSYHQGGTCNRLHCCWSRQTFSHSLSSCKSPFDGLLLRSKIRKFWSFLDQRVSIVTNQQPTAGPKGASAPLKRAFDCSFAPDFLSPSHSATFQTTIPSSSPLGHPQWAYPITRKRNLYIQIGLQC
jgi:hypothetical protein